MISDKDFFKLLFDDTLNESVEENLKRIIDEELEKPKEEIDSDLLEYCLDELGRLESEKSNIVAGEGKELISNEKKVKYRKKKWIIVAAAVLLFIVGAVSVSAIVDQGDLWKGVIEFYDDHIRINFKQRESDDAENYSMPVSELAQELKKHGFDSVLLPEAILSDEYEITNIEYEETELILTANVVFKNAKGAGYVHIEKYFNEDIVPNNDYQNVSNSIEEIRVGDVSVFCFQQEDDAYTITYKYGLYLYTIFVPNDHDEAINFAKSIKATPHN